jgi:hypothetical protein
MTVNQHVVVNRIENQADLSQVVQTLGSEGVVVPLPRELGLDVTLGGQGLHGLDDLQVADVGDVSVSGSVEVLLSNENTLCVMQSTVKFGDQSFETNTKTLDLSVPTLEEVLVDGPAVLLGNEHF